MPAHNPLIPRLPSYPEVREGVKKFVAGMQPPPDPEAFTVSGEDAPEAIDPRMEGRAPFFPYRGEETHGVPATAYDDANPQGYTDGTVGVVYDDDSRKDPVVNVRVISDAKEEIKGFRATQTAVGNQPAIVVNRQRGRNSLMIKHLGIVGGVGDTRVWLGHDSTVGALNGYPLDPGGEITIASTEAVWMVSNDLGETAPLAIFTDYVMDV